MCKGYLTNEIHNSEYRCFSNVLIPLKAWCFRRYYVFLVYVYIYDIAAMGGGSKAELIVTDIVTMMHRQ